MILILQYAAGPAGGCRMGIRRYGGRRRQFLDIGTGLRSIAPAGSAASRARQPAGSGGGTRLGP